MVHLTQEEFEALFAGRPEAPLGEAGTPICPYCAHPLAADALDYWNGETEYGTPYCQIEIVCTACHRDIWRGGGWTTIESRDELAEEARDLLDEAIGPSPARGG